MTGFSEHERVVPKSGMDTYAYLMTLEWNEYTTSSPEPLKRTETVIATLDIHRGYTAESRYFALFNDACDRAGVREGSDIPVVRAVHFTKED